MIDIAADFKSWNHTPISRLIGKIENKNQLLKLIHEMWQAQKKHITAYDSQCEKREVTFSIIEHHKNSLGLGRCPVSSPKTRCCQLYTLDAVDNCGQDCSYCSIQSFFSDNKVFFDTDFAKKLDSLKLDLNKNYHIGTGQSSDSLLWGNKGNILKTIFDFAKKWPNVIIELKSKTSNIEYLLEHDIPHNVICTWSLNPQTIIDNEEHGTSSLKQRIEAAHKITAKGNLVGFHFHPIFHYHNWKQDYRAIINILIQRFSPNNIAMVSLGTLTYTKNIIKKIRARNIQTKVLQIPFEEIEGKYSYPLHIKEELFKTVYQLFTPWHEEVFFYLCMEDTRLWEPVFGHQYDDNDQFEQVMFTNYQTKIKNLKIIKENEHQYRVPDIPS